jgi:hypothetical protein
MKNSSMRVCVSKLVRFTLTAFLCGLPWSAMDLPVTAGTAVGRDLVTDEPNAPKGRPSGVPDYRPVVDAAAGRHLGLSLKKLRHGIDPPRPFLIWAIGSSYTNMLGNGEIWKEELPRRFPAAPPVVYRKMVGNSCPWQYLRGWARHLVIPDQPDLIIIYTLGRPEDLDTLLVELRSQTTADIIVPSIHWRERDQALWGLSESAVDQDVAVVRAVCAKHGVEFVENRRAWAAYLAANHLPISALLKDAVHQSDYGAEIINRNILAHLRESDHGTDELQARERRIEPPAVLDGSGTVAFTGTRIDLVGTRSFSGGRLRVIIDDEQAGNLDAFVVSYVQPDASNARVGRGSVPRDQAPHGVAVGRNVIPQEWTIVMTSDKGDYELTGSLTGGDGIGNAFQPFTSMSGQIVIEPDLWRRAERNRTGDRFTFSVRRACLDAIDFAGPEGERFIVRIAQMLANGPHRLTLHQDRPGPTPIEWLEVYEPPLKLTP